MSEVVLNRAEVKYFDELQTVVMKAKQEMDSCTIEILKRMNLDTTLPTWHFEKRGEDYILTDQVVEGQRQESK